MVETRGNRKRKIEADPELAKKEKDRVAAEEKEKMRKMTLGQYLEEQREEEREKIEDSAPEASSFEYLKVYSKDEITKGLGKAEQVTLEGSGIKLDNVFRTKNNVIAVLLSLTQETEPKLTHMCNADTVKWDLSTFNIPSRHPFLSAIPATYMVFLEAEEVEGKGKYVYAGLMGVKTVSSDSKNYKCCTLLFEPKLNRKEVARFGNYVLKCKKNKYGATLCNF